MGFRCNICTFPYSQCGWCIAKEETARDGKWKSVLDHMLGHRNSIPMKLGDSVIWTLVVQSSALRPRTLSRIEAVAPLDTGNRPTVPGSSKSDIVSTTGNKRLDFMIDWDGIDPYWLD
jgi:hypothetical protein